MAFYEIKDRVHALMGEMEEFAGHMEVCNAIFAVNFANREAEKGGAVYRSSKRNDRSGRLQ